MLLVAILCRQNAKQTKEMWQHCCRRRLLQQCRVQMMTLWPIPRSSVILEISRQRIWLSAEDPAARGSAWNAWRRLSRRRRRRWRRLARKSFRSGTKWLRVVCATSRPKVRRWRRSATRSAQHPVTISCFKNPKLWVMIKKKMRRRTKKKMRVTKATSVRS